MKAQYSYYNCGSHLQEVLATEISEVESAVQSVRWVDSFSYTLDERSLEHQKAYNAAFRDKFLQMGWTAEPRLLSKPSLIGDFSKGLVFVEIQFGNSSTLYRDYYKFQYGLANGLLSLAVLVVPIEPKEFFPVRQSTRSVSNMAKYSLADKCLTLLPINVPTLLIGLKPEN